MDSWKAYETGVHNQRFVGGCLEHSGRVEQTARGPRKKHVLPKGGRQSRLHESDDRGDSESPVPEKATTTTVRSKKRPTTIAVPTPTKMQTRYASFNPTPGPRAPPQESSPNNPEPLLDSGRPQKVSNSKSTCTGRRADYKNSIFTSVTSIRH